MSLYKLESTYKLVPFGDKPAEKRTYRFFCNSYESMSLRLRNELINKSKVTIKEISEYEYIRSQNVGG